AWSTLGLSTRWVVAGAVGAALLVRRDPETLAWVIGSVANATLSKVLKKLLNHTRPEGSDLQDPGMPSSHAMSLFFLGTYVIIALRHGSPAWCPLDPLATQAAVAAYAVIASAWRVRVGYHSTAQIVVGAVAGTAFSCLW
ncbi:unnamed protein product, partial [Phaeothamnion confervicola]